ncbi:MAG: hypothetical protein OEY58_19455 [Gammaproteobacteria bacterium]|nr:hypothetical protein [Gammaproteobacteria bacterium]
MSTILVVEWFASLATVAGAGLLAFNCRYSAWGWLFFLIANILWLTYGYLSSDMAISLQTMVLTGTSIIGIYRWLLKPRFFVQL